mgnify:CR=1 FL=1|jgi:hypothetical protein
MIPDDVSFHDAVIEDIRSEGKNLVFAVEDVVVDDGEEISPGLLTFEDVRQIAVDGKSVPALEMAGDDGEIADLQLMDGPVVKLVVLWTHHDSHEETTHSYRIECRNVRWKRSD